MWVRGRVRELGRQRTAAVAAARPRPSDPEWVAVFGDAVTRGVGRRVPGFTAAVADYRAAVAADRAGGRPADRVRPPPAAGAGAVHLAAEGGGMRVRGRLDRLVAKVKASRPDAVPLTVFLSEATADRPVGTVVLWGGRAREVTYDPAAGPPPLPPGGPHLLIAGPAFDV